MEEKENILDLMSHRENPFRVPEGYFPDFQRKLEANISHAEQETKEKKIPLYVRLRPVMYVAASFLAFVFCIQLYLSGIVKTDKASALNADTTAVQHAEAAILYTYVDDLALMNYLATHEEEKNK